MKKFITIATLCLIGGACFAGGPHGMPPYYRHQPPRRSEGVVLAADIVRLVGASLRLVPPRVVYREVVVVPAATPAVVVEQPPVVIIERREPVVIRTGPYYAPPYRPYHQPPHRPPHHRPPHRRW